MNRICALLFLLVFSFATAMQAQAQAPKPDPELKKLSVFVGHWTYEGEHQAGLLGPAGKFTGERDAWWILGGFYLETREREKGPAGEAQFLEIEGYDPAKRNFTHSAYGSGGIHGSAAFTSSSGTTWTFSGKGVAGAKPYTIRGTITFAPDLLSTTGNFEVSTDGKTWMPLFEVKSTKTPPAPKK